MIKLTDFTPVNNTTGARTNESYLVFERKDAGKDCARIKLSAEDYRSVIKYIGNAVKVYTGQPGEFVLTRGDRRIAATRNSGGKLSIVSVTKTLREAFPDAMRVYLKGEWDKDENSNVVFHLQPTGKVTKDERIVTSRSLKDGR